MTVILLRHGRSTANTARTLAGRSSGVALDELGVEQAKRVVERLAGLSVVEIVHSPLLRCEQTVAPWPSIVASPPESTTDWSRSTTDSGPGVS